MLCPSIQYFININEIHYLILSNILNNTYRIMESILLNPISYHKHTDQELILWLKLIK